MLAARAQPARVVEMPRHVIPASAVKSALLQSSLSGMEKLGLADRYFAALPTEHHEAMRTLVVGQWNPMELGVAHYGAIDSLRLSSMQAKANGRAVAEKVQVSFARTVFRGLGTAVTPLDALKRLPAFMERLIQGGGVAVDQLGPKDARATIIEVPIGRFDYVREGWAGMFEATLGLLTHKVMTRNVSPRGADTIVLEISWV